jgi:serine protease Do
MKKYLIFFFLTIALLTQLKQALSQDKKSTIETKNSPKIQNDKTPEVAFSSSKQLVANSFADTVEDLLPTVVNISTIQEIQTGNSNVDQILLGELPKAPLFDDFRKQLENQLRGSGAQKKKISSIGSGFIISKDGFIVTNNHVIDDADEITVSTNDGIKYKAKIIGIDKRTDLAVLKINPNKDLKFVKFGDSSKSRIGDWVIVVGNPYGLGGSVSVGIVSARGRDIKSGQGDDFIQTDAAINKGNSGGPMFNTKGEVIGISTAIFSPSGGSVGIGFATPSSTAIQVVKQLKEQGEVMRGWIGVSVQDVSDDIAESMKMEKSKGAFVVDLTKDGPAEKAGILPTDIIVKFDDQEIDEMKILPKTVASYPIGKTTQIVVWRQGKLKTFKIKVEKMREETLKKTEIKVLEKKQTVKPVGQILGLSLAELKSKIKKDKNEINLEGLLITDISAKSEAAEKGILNGDIILSVNQVPVLTISDLKKIVDETAKSGKKLFLFIKRGDDNYAVVLNSK